MVDPISGGDSAAVGEGALGLSDVLPSLPISVAAEFGGVGTRTAASALRFFNPLPVPLEQAALRPADSPIMRDVLQRTVALAIRAGRVHDARRECGRSTGTSIFNATYQPTSIDEDIHHRNEWKFFTSSQMVTRRVCTGAVRSD